MANISITSACNRDCSYCFARNALATHGAGGTMTLQTFALALQYVRRSEANEVRLLGGEPTLHPQFSAMADMVLAAGLRLVVFSNGLMPKDSLKQLCKIEPGRVRVVVNASALVESEPTVIEIMRRTLRLLGRRAMLGANLHTRQPRLGGLLAAISDLDLLPRLRLGLAHPTLGGSNNSLPPKLYRQIGRFISTLARNASERGVALDLDCGFVPCMFEDESLPGLDVAIADCGKRCNSLPDVLPNGQVIACYPLAELGALALEQSTTDARIRSHFKETLAPYSTLGIFPECSACELLSDHRCLGGCRAAALRRLVPASKPFVPEIQHGWRKRWQVESAPHETARSAPGRAEGQPRPLWVVPYVDQPIEAWQQLKTELGASIKEIYFPLSDKLLGSGRPPQPNAQLEAFLKWRGLAGAALVNPIVLQRPISEVAPGVVTKLTRLRDLYGIQAATVADVNLAQHIREALPEFELTASIQLDLCAPIQTVMLTDTFDVLVPSGRILRDRAALRALRQAFSGRIRLMVNEGCLPGCPFRIQHFFEMQSGCHHPRSLCADLLERQPWLRLTGAWVLPQHLHLYDDLFDELKLDGRATLHDSQKYREVLRAYVERTPLSPNAIGGGPASVLTPIDVSEEHFRIALNCAKDCHSCLRCADYYRARSPASKQRGA